MEKLATYIVREGALPARDAAGWIVRLCLTLEPHHASGVGHGRVSAKAIHIESPSASAPGYLLDAPDLADDPAYFSLDRASGGVRSPESDTWAVGVTFYFALTGALPFAGNSADEVRDRLVHSIAAPLAVFDAGDDNLQLLLDQLFSRNFQERLKSLRQVRERLIAWDSALGQLPPLAYGRPDFARDIDDDTSDDDDNPMQVTSVAHKALYPELKAEILAQRERRERSADPPPPPQTSADLLPPPGTVVLDAQVLPEPENQNPEFGTTMVSEPDPPEEPVQNLGRTLVMTDGDDLARTQVREPQAPPPRPLPTRNKMRTPFADTLPAASVPQEGRAALARALGKTPPPPPPRSSGPPSSGPTHELPKATRPLSPALRRDWPRAIEPIPPTLDAPATPRPPRAPPPLHAPPATPAASGIISGEIPSALELLSRPDSTPPPPPDPTRLSPPPMVPVVPPRRKRRSFFGRLLVWLLLVGAGYVTFRFYGAAIWRYATRMVPALRRMEKEKPAPTPRPAPVPSATTSATVSAATPVPSAAAATDVQACVAPLFPANTFVSGQSDLSFVCSETEPANGAKSLRNQVVVGAGKDATSEAMKEWSTLGWYGMAVFAIARARCCKDAPPLSTPTVLKDCALDESLTRLGAATFETSNDASEKALYAYRGAVKCIVKNGAAQAFGQQGEPRGGELTTFKKTYERARRLIAQK